MHPTPDDPRYPCGRRVSRRGFLLGAAGGLAIGAPLGWYALKRAQARDRPSPFTGRSREVARPENGMPGRFPGRVAEVRHRAVIDDTHYAVDPGAVRAMVQHGMCLLTGADDAAGPWRRFFTRDDVVGIKVNPVGRKALPGEGGRVQDGPASISSPELLLEVVRCLTEYVGLPRRNIIVFDRYANEFRQAGYETLLRTRPMEGVRWYAASQAYEGAQVAIDGQGAGGSDPHVVGYDPDAFVSMGFAAPEHDPRDDRRFRSHLSVIVTRMVNKIINIPCLKDHKSAGVTLALKNLSHGLNNNVARSHLSGIYRLGGAASGPNQCNTFIPTAVAQPALRAKATLHILDGLVGVYEGGPGNWNRTWGTWLRKSLFFATDPVALDHVGWDIIDTRRALEGWAPVAHMGLVQGREPLHLSPRLAALAALGSPHGAAALLLDHQRRRAAVSEPFDRRQPEHIALAGLLGLGTFNAVEIDHRVQQLA
jgi:hypothetical protein